MTAPEDRTDHLLQCRAMLKSFIRSVVSNADEAEDLLQEVSVRVLGEPDAPPELDRFRAWCRGVCRNVIIQHWRARYRSRDAATELYVTLMAQAYAEADDERIDWTTRQRALGDCVRRLGRDDRHMIVARYVDNRTSESIGEKLNRSAVAIRQSLMRIRLALQKCVESRLGASEPGGAS